MLVPACQAQAISAAHHMRCSVSEVIKTTTFSSAEIRRSEHRPTPSGLEVLPFCRFSDAESFVRMFWRGTFCIFLLGKMIVNKMFKFKYLTLHGVLGDVFQYLYGVFFFWGGRKGTVRSPSVFCQCWIGRVCLVVEEHTSQNCRKIVN
jgi:hypothetical protein